MSDVHGMDPVAWDDYRFPAWFWRSMTVCTDTGCWLAKEGLKHPQVTVARRVLGVTRDQLLAVVPTCGEIRCANPAHLCVTLRAQ